MDVETHVYSDGQVQSEVIIPHGEFELVVVDKKHLDHLETYVREAGEQHPFAKLGPNFFRSSAWPEPPETADVNSVTGTVTLD